MQYIVLYKLHVIDTFVCGSFFLSCFYDNLNNMVIMNNYSYDTFLYYNAIIFYSTNMKILISILYDASAQR